MKKNFLDWFALILVVIGAVNWGLVGAFNFNLVEFITLNISWLSRTIYILVGIAGLYSIWAIIKELI